MTMDPLNVTNTAPDAETVASEPRPSRGYCRRCGKPLTDETRREAMGTVFCEEHVPVAAGAAPEPQSPYVAPDPRTVSASGIPGLAFVLGFIPGVGAIYNGQYGKGFLHAVLFGLLVSLASNDQLSGGLGPLFGILTAVFVFYQCFEAYHTARKRAAGEAVDEFSSILPSAKSGLPLLPVALILLGVIFLLNNFGLLRVADFVRFWPLLLIGAGAAMLWSRVKGYSDTPGTDLQRTETQP